MTGTRMAYQYVVLRCVPRPEREEFVNVGVVLHCQAADFLDVERFPTITFRSTRVEPGRGGAFRVVGALTIRGVTRRVVLEAEQTGRGASPYGAEVIGFEATTTFNRKDFGLTWNQALETGGVVVGDEIKITIDLEAVRQG